MKDIVTITNENDGETKEEIGVRKGDTDCEIYITNVDAERGDEEIFTHVWLTKKQLLKLMAGLQKVYDSL